MTATENAMIVLLNQAVGIIQAVIWSGAPSAVGNCSHAVALMKAKKKTESVLAVEIARGNFDSNKGV